MAGIAILGSGDPVAALLKGHLERSPAVARCDLVMGGGSTLREQFAALGCAAVIYPAASRGHRGLPDAGDAANVFAGCRDAAIAHLVLLSSTAIHAPSHKHPGRVDERYGAARSQTDPIAVAWRELEQAAHEALAGSSVRLTILRPAPVLLRGNDDYFNRLLSRSIAVTYAGHDPTLQFLAAEDLGAAVVAAIEGSPGGTYHLVPNGAVPLRKALRLAGVRRLPAPRWLHRVVRAAAAPAGIAAPLHQVDRLRYGWTAGGERARRRLGFTAQRSSAQAIRSLAGGRSGAWEETEASSEEAMTGSEAAASSGKAREISEDSEAVSAFDEFGLDSERIAAWRRRHIKFLHDVYWRVEVTGSESLPRHGAAVAVGIHRGFMPFDGVMALNTIVGETGRVPRFLIHPGLVKFPFLADYMFKLGGVIACRENADYLLEREEMLAVFPEGIRGAFTYYRDAYRLAGFGRPDYVRMALRHGAPILPFVTVGSAEIFPILAKIDWPWWKRFTEWPCLPLTPTFPLLPVPLPSKWHTRFLAPLPVQELYPPEAADDAEVVARIDRQVQSLMATTMEDMLGKRASVWYGSIFTGDTR